MNRRLDKRDRDADGAYEREAVSAGQAAVKEIRQFLRIGRGLLARTLVRRSPALRVRASA
jgi:hypothetical protein